MSRWDNNYAQKNEFDAVLTELQTQLEEFDRSNITDENILAEFGRYEKALLHIENFSSLIDPDLNKHNAFADPLNNLQMVFYEFNDFFISKDVADIEDVEDIENLNDHLDDVIDDLKTLQIPLPNKSKKSIAKAAQKYHRIIDTALEQIDLNGTKSASQEIKELKNSLIDADDSIQSQINNTKSVIDQQATEINETHKWLLDGTEETESVKDKFIEAEEAIKSILQNSNDASNELDKLRKFYTEIYGVTQTDPEDATKTIQVDSLKNELEDRLKQLSKLEEEHTETYQALKEKINSLLPGAASAGLAKSFHDEREKFEKPIKVWNYIFMCSLVAIFAVTAFNLDGTASIQLASTSWKDAVSQFLSRLPLLAPIVWLAIYAGRRRGEQQRLEQEYAHKEAFAKAYSSYKKQIEQTQDTDQKLITDLLAASIKTLAYNASETLDKKQRDDTLINELEEVFKEHFKELLKDFKKNKEST